MLKVSVLALYTNGLCSLTAISMRQNPNYLHGGGFFSLFMHPMDLNLDGYNIMLLWIHSTTLGFGVVARPLTWN